MSRSGQKESPAEAGLMALLLLRSTNGAHICAGTAIDAGIRVDDVLAVAFRDGANGAAFCTGTAGNAIVRNLICHNEHLQRFYQRKLIVKLYAIRFSCQGSSGILDFRHCSPVFRAFSGILHGTVGSFHGALEASFQLPEVERAGCAGAAGGGVCSRLGSFSASVLGRPF